MTRTVLRRTVDALLSIVILGTSIPVALAADASKLPRLSGSTEIYASPEMAIYKTSGEVDVVAKAARAALEAEGWRSFVAIGTDPQNLPSLAQQFLKKDGVVVSIFTTLAPGQGIAPTVQYTFQPIASDLPFPKDAKGIEFAGNRPELITRTPGTLNALKAEMTAALETAGYSPVAAAEGSPAALAATPMSNQTYFVKTGAKPLLLVLATQEGGDTLVHLRGIPEKDLLAGTRPKPAPEPEVTTTEDKAKGGDEFDAMMSGILGKVKEATEKAIEGKPANLDLDALLGAVKGKPKADVPDDVEQSAAESAPAKPAVEEEVTLEVEEANGLPFPKPYTEKVATKTGFRTEVKTTVSADLDRILAFYRTELGKKGWTEDRGKSQTLVDKASLVFTTPDGPANLEISTMSTGTSSHLILRLPKEAEARGLMPKPGKAMLVMSNAMEEPVSVTLAGKTYKLGSLSGTNGATSATTERHRPVPAASAKNQQSHPKSTQSPLRPVRRSPRVAGRSGSPPSRCLGRDRWRSHQGDRVLAGL